MLQGKKAIVNILKLFSNNKIKLLQLRKNKPRKQFFKKANKTEMLWLLIKVQVSFFLAMDEVMEYTTCSYRKTSKCLTSICECPNNGFHYTDLCKCSGCANEENAENEKWNYSDIDSDYEDEFII